VKVLVVIALVGCAVAGVLAFLTSTGRTVGELQADGDHVAILANWWVPGSADGMLLLALFFLVVGALVGGATVAGAEWRAGTVTALLTWEPRRVRVHLARVVACTMLAAAIAFARRDISATT
jgi:hypothetical protein